MTPKTPPNRPDMPAKMECEFCHQMFDGAYMLILERGREIYYVCAACYNRAQEGPSIV